MALDRRLSPNFMLHEFPGAAAASEDDVARLRWTVENILQPTRDRWGPLKITSWKVLPGGRSELGAGGHRDAGTVDFVPLGAPVPAVHRWMGYFLRGRYGELIDERSHIHVTRPGIGGDGELLVEFSEGRYAAVDPAVPFPGGTGAPGDPLELEELEVSVARAPDWFGWGLVAGALLLAFRDR